jgi:hypothetical protein
MKSDIGFCIASSIHEPFPVTNQPSSTHESSFISRRNGASLSGLSGRQISSHLRYCFQGRCFKEHSSKCRVILGSAGQDI